MFQRNERSERFGRRSVEWEGLLIGPTTLGGGEIESAKLQTPGGATRASIFGTFSDRGGRRFGKLTARLVGRRLAMVLDGRLLSAPRVMERIDSGRVLLPVGQTLDTARAIAAALSTDALPAGIELKSFEAK